MGVTSGLDVNIFKRFKECWSILDSTKYCSGVDVTEGAVHGNMKLLENQLCLKPHQDGYQELLEFSLILLGRS